MNLKVPLYTGGNTTSLTKQAEFAYVAASQDLEAAYRSVVKDVRAYNNNINASIGALRAYEQAVISAKSALEATEAGLMSVRVPLSMYSMPHVACMMRTKSLECSL